MKEPRKLNNMVVGGRRGGREQEVSHFIQQNPESPGQAWGHSCLKVLSREL